MSRNVNLRHLLLLLLFNICFIFFFYFSSPLTYKLLFFSRSFLFEGLTEVLVLSLLSSPFPSLFPSPFPSFSIYLYFLSQIIAFSYTRLNTSMAYFTLFFLRKSTLSLQYRENIYPRFSILKRKLQNSYKIFKYIFLPQRWQLYVINR